ncbi:MAG: DUF3553 domain-containing protein [Candidatus Aminicenantes bacterium]|nr:DUF3553 domain-containing protein [Candidatus Aminicenantes bacterium]
MTTDLTVGDRVRHPTKTEWGIGQVLSVQGSKASVFFVETGTKIMSLNHVSLTILDPPPSHPLLERIDPKAAAGAAYQSLNQSIDDFRSRYPGGFHGERYLHEERDYKVEAHELGKTILSRVELERLLENRAFADVCRSALQVVNKTNLIFPNEKMSLRDGLKPTERKKIFALALHALLHGENAFRSRFQRFASVLDEVGAAKWTVATYFPFLLYPDQHQFIKPKYSQNAASICAFDIKYTPRLSWRTYKQMLRFSDYLKSELAILEPRDNIDIQSFMWAIAQG